MRVDRCKQCGAAIVWAINNATMKKAPLDARPWPNYGNIDLDTQRMTYVVLEPEVVENARARGFELYTNHLGTCPARERVPQETEYSKQETEVYEHAN